MQLLSGVRDDGVVGSETRAAIHRLSGRQLAAMQAVAASFGGKSLEDYLATPKVVEDASIVSIIEEEALKQGFNPGWALAVARLESKLNPTLVSPTGARGLFQLTRVAIEDVRQKFGLPAMTPAREFDPRWNASVGISYLRLCIVYTQRNGYDITLPNVYAHFNVGLGTMRLMKERQYDNSTVQQAVGQQADFLSKDGPRGYLRNVERALLSA